MPNPYDSPRPDDSVRRQKAVVRPLCFAMATALLSVAVSIPGVVMLNQKMQVLPTTSYITGVELNGTPVDDSSVITYSLGIAILLLFAGMYFLSLSLRNWAFNRSKLRPD